MIVHDGEVPNLSAFHPPSGNAVWALPKSLFVAQLQGVVKVFIGLTTPSLVPLASTESTL